MMGDGVIDLRAIRAMVENAGYRGHCEVEILSAETGGSAIPMRFCASASSGTGRWCDDHQLRRHHPRRRTQRPHPAGLSRQGRPEDIGDRSAAGRGRRTEHGGRPAPSRLPAQHPRLLPARDHRHAVVRRSRARTARRPLHRARAQCRAAHRRRTRAGMVDRSAQDDRIIRRLQPPRRRHAAALARRVRADRAGHPGARGPLAATAAAGAARAAGAHQRRPAAARSERAVAAAVRRAGIRASHHQGRTPLLQRAARGRSAAAAASAITSPRCWRARPRRRCRAAARRRWRARSKRRCARRAARSG